VSASAVEVPVAAEALRARPGLPELVEAVLEQVAGELVGAEDVHLPATEPAAALLHPVLVDGAAVVVLVRRQVEVAVEARHVRP
jgi:hydrogenase/urease accessory protein HupE